MPGYNCVYNEIEGVYVSTLHDDQAFNRYFHDSILLMPN